jgi:hypothetical protein
MRNKIIHEYDIGRAMIRKSVAEDHIFLFFLLFLGIVLPNESIIFFLLLVIDYQLYLV